MSIEQRIADWDGVAVVTRQDRPTGAWCFVALHDDRLGPPVGGTRIKVYPTPADGLRDAQRLAEGMTHKWAAIDMPFGGGKAVLALARPLEAEEHRGLLERYAGLLRTLHGAFQTGQDLGTTPDDMCVLARGCSHVHGYDPTTGQAMDPGPFTALGVHAGIRAAVESVFGSPELAGRSILIEGFGGVGRPLARSCAAEGARLLVADLDEKASAAAAAELGAAVVPVSSVPDTACDVYAPCATGQTLRADTIERLQCRIVAGSANNQLDRPEDAESLHRRGILYAPDYVINAGGALGFGSIHMGETDDTVLRERIRGLGDVLREIFGEADRAGESPLHAARRRVDRVLARAAARRE